MASENRLISADRFCDFVDENCTDRHAELWKELIRRQPTVDAVEVVHAKWLFDSGTERHFCSACNENALSVTYGEQVADYDWEENLVFHAETVTKEFWTDYCPNCGAKMDGGNEDG